MQYHNLSELRELRNTIKACEARIDKISDAATEEAVAILAEKGLDRGELEADGHTFQLQRTEVIDMSNHHRTRKKMRSAGARRKPHKSNPKNTHPHLPRR